MLSLLRRGKGDSEIVAHYTVSEFGLTEKQVACLRASVASAPPAPPLLSSTSTPSKTLSKQAHGELWADTPGRGEEVGIGLTLTSSAPYDVLKLAQGGAAHLSGQVLTLNPKPGARTSQRSALNTPDTANANTDTSPRVTSGLM